MNRFIGRVLFGAVLTVENCHAGDSRATAKLSADRGMVNAMNGPQAAVRRVGVACRKKRSSGRRRVRRDAGASLTSASLGGGCVGASPEGAEVWPEAAERFPSGERDAEPSQVECHCVTTGKWSAADGGAEAGVEANGRPARSAMHGLGCVCRLRLQSGECRTSDDERAVRRREAAAASRLSASNFDDMSAAAISPGNGSDGRRKSSAGSWPRRRARRSPIHSLSEALLIGVWFISLLRLPTLSLAVPLGRGIPSVSMAEDRFNSRPKWINACGAHVDSPDGRQSLDGPHSPGGGGSPPLDHAGEHFTDEQLISRILIVAKNALMHAGMWRRDYVNQTFNVDFVQHHEAWRTNRYSWLPTLDDIPKELEEPTPDAHLEKMNFVDALKNTFTFMQKYACGLEQVTWDLEDKHSSFSKNFKDAELQLRDIICEIEEVLIEKGEKVPSDVQRSIMPKEFRSVSHETHRNLRDWLIFRDYMNGVEYVIQVFEYLKGKM